MSFGNYPPAFKRKVILVLDGAYFDDMERQGEGFLLDPELYVLNIQRAEEEGIPDSLRYSGLLRHGNHLVQSPFNPNEYREINDAEEYFELEKYLYFSEACRLLGVRKLSLKKIGVVSREENFSMEISGQYSLSPKTSSGYEKEHVENLLRKIEVNDKFEGGQPDYEALEKFLKEKKLDEDEVIRSLINARKGKNPIIERRLKLNISREIRNNMDLFLKVKVPDVFAIKGKIKKNLEKKIERYLEFFVEF